MNRLLSLFSREQLSKIENIVTLFIYYGLPGIVVITLISAMINGQNPGYSRQEWRGGNGWSILAILLFIKPIILLSRKYLNAQSVAMTDVILAIKQLPQTLKTTKITLTVIKTKLIPYLINCVYSISTYLIRFRRQLGLATFWMILTHFLLWQIFRVRQGLPVGFNIEQPTIFTGMIGLIALLAGALTSNMFAVKLLKTNRKKVQMLAYVAFFFGAIHTGNIFWLIVYAVLKYLELKELGTIAIRKTKIITLHTKLTTKKKSA